MSTIFNRKRSGIPPAPPHLLARDRLSESLERGAASYRLVLVSAPAGYGKTTTLASWARGSSLPVVWMTVERSDNDVERFLRYLLTAWERVDPGIADQPPGILLGSAMPDIETTLEALVESAARRADPLVFVIDDYQVIDSEDVHRALTYLLDHLPQQAHIILGTREQPPLPLARYRARQQLLEIGPDDLRFRSAETSAFLNEALALGVPAETAETIGKQVEGWVAGLQLASLSLREGRLPPSSTISGRHRFIADFLREEVLSDLPQELRDFLVATSIVDRINASLATALTHNVEAQDTLEELERAGLFTEPLDDTREWYRYHRLFAEVLRDELDRQGADIIVGLHRRAARWYIAHDMPDPAFTHAIAAGDIPLVTDVLNAFALVKMFSGQIGALQEWLRAIPPTWVDAEPNIGIFRAGVLFFTGQMDACTQCLAEVERAVRSANHPMPATAARLTAMRCFIACTLNDLDSAQSYGDMALQTLVPADDKFRSGVLGALGDTYRRNGYWDEAHKYYLQALQHIDNPEGHVQAIHGYGGLADLELRRGHLHAAAGYWRKALAKVEDPTLWGVYPLPLTGWVYTRYGEIHYEWNDLETAQHYADRGRERTALGGDPRSIIASALLTARLHLARGEHDEAEAIIDEVRPITTDAQIPEWASEFERLQVDLWLAQGKLRTAVAWSDEVLAREVHSLPDREPTALALSRVLIVKGDARAGERALDLVGTLIDVARAEGRIGLGTAALNLRALALEARGDRPGALTALEPALREAGPEGYVRSFIDLGLPMARLLQMARDRNILPDYVVTLLAAFDASVIAYLPAGAALPEPLSEREREVLRHIAAGLTNREIADALFISAETVKKHTGNIYGKLAVRGRTEAIARARDLDLLD